MKARNILTLSYHALKDRKVRSLLTILMVVVGSALIVSLNGLSTGFSGFIDEQFSFLSPNILIITPAQEFRQGPPTPGAVTELNARVAKTLESIAGVKTVLPTIQAYADIRSAGESFRVAVLGLDQSKIDLVFPKFSLEEGRLVYPYDNVGLLFGRNVKYPPGSSTPFAALGQSVVLELESVDQAVGNGLTNERRTFLVRGSANGLGSGFVLPIDSSVVVSLDTADKLFKKGGSYNYILAVTNSADINDRVENRIKEVYGDNIGISSPKTIVETIQSVIGGFTVFIVGIAAISLLVAAVGVVTTLITSVMERTREIGVLKALGFTDRTVLLMFLSEACIIGSLGGFIGITLGIAMGTFVLPSLAPGTQGIRITPIFSPAMLTEVWLFAVALSALAGLYPAWRASRLDPVVALRKE